MSGRIRHTLCVALAAAACAAADVTLPAVFSDHMVLQAGMAVPVFGTAAPGEQVRVAVAGKQGTVTAGPDGRWLVRLEPLAPGGPHELTVRGTNTLTVKDVLAGEVWLASGQSNMRFPLSRTRDAAAAMAAAGLPQVRYCRDAGPWTVCTPQTCADFSAVAFFFAADLHAARRTPVGIIENAVSGAVAQVFVRGAVFEADPALREAVARHTHDTGANGAVWDAAFAPVVPYGIRGALWFQGEGNRDFPVTYRALLTALIADWRRAWGQGDLPFLVCQLANWTERRPEPREGRDCYLREAQAAVVRAVPNTALVVTIDLNDGTDVHFPDKQPCGRRLALAARGLAYGEEVEYSGPVFAAARFEGGRAVVTFTHATGLAARGGPPAGFLLCGADRKWVRAEAVLQGDTAVVTSPAVAAPVAVRYAWEVNPACNLYNAAGLPAAPFRSDTFECYFSRDAAD